MQSFISFIYNSKEYFVLIAALLVSLILISNNNNQQVRAMRGGVLDIYRTVQKPVYLLTDLINVREENKRIRQKNIDLSITVSRLIESKFENERLRDLLNFKNRSSEYEYVTSEVIGINRGSYSSSIILDTGKENGIVKNTPVVNSEGVVGKVVETGTNSSIAQLLNDDNFRISVTINPGNANGIIHGDRGLLDLREVPKGLLVTIGDTVVTSGYSDIFPSGLMVGTVRSVIEKPENFFKEIKVKPAASMSKLKEVFLLLNSVGKVGDTP